MVNRGRSGACATCKERRVKCDETKPDCRACTHRTLRCGGYETKPVKVRFKDQSNKFYGGSRPESKGISTIEVHRRPFFPTPSLIIALDMAVPFFLTHFASLGRGMESTRGFFEMLIPAYCAQQQDSAISLAVSAVSSAMLSMWRHDIRSLQSPTRCLIKAVGRLRTAIQDPIERADPSTTLAVLLLQFHENIAAVYGLRSVTRTHHSGALSLLQSLTSNHPNGVINGHVRRFMFHTEVSLAISEKRSPQTDAYSWLGSEFLEAAPANPSSALDAIGALVAELHARYVRQSAVGLSSLAALRGWRVEAEGIDQQLLSWEQTVPGNWYPARLESGREIDDRVPAYQATCDVYLSCEIATIWNLWRSHRLLIFEIKLAAIEIELAHARNLNDMIEYAESHRTVQELIDSVCYSVPFYLGNRTMILHITDFDNPEILIPSHHPSLPNEREQPSLTSTEDRRRHIIAQGPWHALGPLSRLLALFCNNHSQTVVSQLRPGQKDWIYEQFLRTATLLHLKSNMSCDTMDDRQPVSTSEERYATADVYQIVNGVRKASVLSGGP